MKISLLLISLIFTLSARENPFFPINTQTNIPLTNNQVQKAPALKRATIKLPSSARIVKGVTVKFKNLDGSISEKTIELDNSIDWHLPLFISQNYEINEFKPKKEITKTKKKKTFKKVLALKFIKFYVVEKEMKIMTQDRMIRDFMLVQPHRIVCDFKRDTDLGTTVKNISKVEGFKRISIGTHKGYYRAVITLDGHYQYKIENLKDGYKLTLM
jgi:hypothetical protein